MSNPVGVVAAELPVSKGWRAYFPESVRVNNRWVCDVTVYNGAVKFVVPVAYDRSIDECLPQLQAEIAKRDEVTLKPLPMIEPGTDIDIEEVARAVAEVAVEPLTKEEQIKADIRQARRDEDQQARLAAYSPELQQRIIDADMVDEL